MIKRHKLLLFYSILTFAIIVLIYLWQRRYSSKIREGFQPIQIDINDPILLSWIGNYTTNLTVLTPMNKSSNVSGLLQISTNGASYNNLSWTIYTYTNDIMILYNTANQDEQITLRQVPTASFTKDPTFNKYSFNVANFDKLQFYYIYHRASANASLQSISGQDPTNLYDYSLKLFSPLTSLSQFETNFINGVKPVFPQSNIGVPNFTNMGNQEVFCLSPNDPKNLFSYGDILAGKPNALLKAFNLQIATIQQLQQAWNNGAEWIVPAWVSDPANSQQYQLAYPLQLPRIGGQQTVGVNEFAPQSLTNLYPLIVYGVKPTTPTPTPGKISLNAIAFRGGGYSQIQTNFNGTNTLSINQDGQSVNLSTNASNDLFLLVPYINNGALNGYMIVSDINANNRNYLAINSSSNTLNVAPLPQPMNPTSMIFQYLFTPTGQGQITLVNAAISSTSSSSWIASGNTITLGTCPSASSLNCQFLFNMAPPNNTNIIPNYYWSQLTNQILSSGLPNYKPNAITLTSVQPVNSADDCSALCQKYYLCRSSTWNPQTKECDLNNDSITSSNPHLVSSPNIITKILNTAGNASTSSTLPSIAFAVNLQNHLIYVSEDSPIQSQSAWTQIQQTPLPNGNYFYDISAMADPNTPGQYNLLLLDNTQGRRNIYTGTYMKGQPTSLKYTIRTDLNPQLTLTRVKLYNKPNSQNYIYIGLGHNATNYFIIGYNSTTKSWSNISIVSNPVDLSFDQTNYLYVSSTNQNIYKSTINSFTPNTTIQYQMIPDSCCVTNITFSPDNRLYGIGTDNNIYFKNTNDSTALFNGAQWVGPINIGFPVYQFILL